MKKQTKWLIIALATAIVLAIALVITLSMLPKEQEVADSGKIYVTDIPKTLIKRISLKNQPNAPDYSMSIVQKDGEQTVVMDNNDAGDTYDAYYLNTLLNLASAMEAKQIATDKADKPEDFGLGDKSIKMVVETETGENIELSLGSLTSLKDGYYIKSSAADKVYVIYTYDAETLMRTQYQLRTVMLYPDFGSGYYDVQTVKVEAPNGDVMHVEKMSPDEMSQTALLTSSYKLVEPFPEYVDDQAGGLNFLSPAVSISVRSVAEDHAKDIAKYGLDKPYRLTTANAKGDTTVILIGNAPEGEDAMTSRYIMLEGKDSVMVGAGQFAFLTIDPLDILSSIIWVRNMTDVTGVKLIAGTETYDFKIDDVHDYDDPSKSTFEATLNGKDVEETNVRRWYQLLNLFPTTGKLTDKVSGTPEYTFEFAYRDGSVHTLNLYRLNDMQLAAEMDGLARFYTSANHMKAIMDGVQTILEGGTIQET